MLTVTRYLSVIFVLGILGSAQAFTVTPFSASVWPRTDAELGITDFQIEDFEDTTLIPGLQVELSGGTHNYGPTSTLPRTFNPATEDPNAADVFRPGVWDGIRVLLNHRDPPPLNYSDFAWANITLHVPEGASSLGFSVQNFEVATAYLLINGEFHSFLHSHIPTGSGRNGYVRIDADPGEDIFSVTIDNGLTTVTGDGIAFDHVAFRPALVTVGGSVMGVKPTRVTCSNITTEQKVVLREIGRVWDCKAAGFEVNSGDRLRLTIDGRAD